MNIDRITWFAWWIGSLLIVGSWVNIVSYKIGWIGFCIACISALVSVVVEKYWIMPPNSTSALEAENEELKNKIEKLEGKVEKLEDESQES